VILRITTKDHKGKHIVDIVDSVIQRRRQARQREGERKNYKKILMTATAAGKTAKLATLLENVFFYI
jgi:hypothetical protein